MAKMLILVWSLCSTIQIAWSQGTNPCAGGETFQCADGSTPGTPPDVCPSGAPQCCTNDGSCSEAPKPEGGGGGGGAPGGTSGGAAPGGTTSCTAPPCAAALLNDVASSTVTGTTPAGVNLPVGENIYGPFEAGFGTQQNGILEGLGCSDGNLGHVPGGIDTYTAEQMVAKGCSITLPRYDGNDYISLLDECGGHTQEYHFHEKLSCLYEESGTHSTQVGVASDGQYIYGKWEDYGASTLPLLDACGGHFGITPDSNGVSVYHYHVQDKAPFTIGCYGPATAENGDYKLVTLAECRGLYDECGNGDTTTVDIPTGSVQYDPWCPCYDATGSNVGTQELPVFADAAATTCSGDTCKMASPSPAPSPSPSPAPSPSSSPSPSSGTPSSIESSSTSSTSSGIHRFSSATISYAIATSFL